MSDPRRVVVLVSLLAAVADESGAATGHRGAMAWDTPAIQGRVAAIDTTPPYAFATPELEVGVDAGAFATVDAQRGWLVSSADLLRLSLLHPFTLTSGMVMFEADVPLDYFAPDSVCHAAIDTLFRPEHGGVQPFDATTGVPRAPPTPLDGRYGWKR